MNWKSFFDLFSSSTYGVCGILIEQAILFDPHLLPEHYNPFSWP